MTANPSDPPPPPVDRVDEAMTWLEAWIKGRDSPVAKAIGTVLRALTDLRSDYYELEQAAARVCAGWGDNGLVEAVRDLNVLVSAEAMTQASADLASDLDDTAEIEVSVPAE